MGNAKCKVWRGSGQCRVWSVKWSVEWGVLRVERKGWSVKRVVCRV